MVFAEEKKRHKSKREDFSEVSFDFLSDDDCVYSPFDNNFDVPFLIPTEDEFRYEKAEEVSIRPSANLKDIPDLVPVLAVTATATPEVVTDIQERLLFPKENVFRVGFERPNLAYVVRTTENKEEQLLGWLNHCPGSAVVYVRMRKRTLSHEQRAKDLSKLKK